MGAHLSEYTGKGPCHRVLRPCRVADPVPPKMAPQVPKPSAGPVVEVEAPSSYATAGKVLFVAAGAFAGVLLALIALHLYNSGRRRRAREGRRLHRSLAIYVGGADDEAPSPRGLDPAVLRALPVVAAAVGAGDCAVCLAEFERGEEARALPRCGHRFHVECIDAWFRGNSTCPLCRAAVEAPDDAEARPEVRVDVAADDDAAAKGGAPATGRMSSGTELDKTRRVSASTRSASF
ncbi:hypothetical protein CFC21_034122 [Triticum aestivum]|uniref:RING-type domain-containing protein n=2 Tax=Triticum aestivum TaxID=4565 RepID=A0A9R1F304_WHEAT|nr:RING-H2 finger protein ATL2-like [Triticum dicoccoides]XP_044336676.1 RING-H2 finger protein ATL2-like [Triticum aestivum]KAF7021126.1 hypothetical protein CFC21_034122 [Triticum aestivum]